MYEKAEWFFIAAHPNELDFNDEGLAQVKAGGKLLCIARYKDLLYACAAKCPHAAAPLVNGYVNVQGDIVCPVHRYKFNLQSGKNTTGEGYHLRTYPVEEREDGWYVGIEKSGWPGL